MTHTAVEWFEQKLDDLDIEIPFGIYEQALEIEKQQIQDAFNAGLKNEKFEAYFNEKFKK